MSPSLTNPDTQKAQENGICCADAFRIGGGAMKCLNRASARQGIRWRFVFGNKRDLKARLFTGMTVSILQRN
jgi:hypothetical protein